LPVIDAFAASAGGVCHADDYAPLFSHSPASASPARPRAVLVIAEERRAATVRIINGLIQAVYRSPAYPKTT
jgi:hypothetical protein